MSLSFKNMEQDKIYKVKSKNGTREYNVRRLGNLLYYQTPTKQWKLLQPKNSSKKS